MITMTHSARQALQRFMVDEGPEVGLRVYITPGGCSGFSYGMVLEDQYDDADEIFEQEGVRVVVTSRKTQLADQALFRFVGIEPREQGILVVKSSVHFRADFAPISEEILVAAAPGPMIADPSRFNWTRLRRGIRLGPNGPVF